MVQYYLKLAHLVDINDSSKGYRQYIRNNQEWPKYSVHGLGINSINTAKELAKLEIDETYKHYKRIENSGEN